jgi:hypothetical protein
MSSLGPSIQLGLALAFAIAFSGCDGCRHEHPFTPFVVTSSSQAQSSQIAPSPATGNNDVAPAVGEKQPPNTREFSLDARQAQAPESMAFDSVLRVDWNNDGKVDGLALLRAAQNETHSIGALYLYDGAGDAKKLLDLPGWIPSSQDCAWDTRLLRVAAHAATLDVAVHCNSAMPPRTATRLLAVVSPMRTEPLMIAWRLAEPVPGENYTATVNVRDRDGDGSDDVGLYLELGLASSKDTARAEFVWFDRAAGVSRESGHFAASLGPTLSNLEKKAASHSGAADAAAGAGLIWRLLGSSCAESSTPRLFAYDGSPLACENLGSVVARLASIEAHAALSQNDVLRAAFALSRAQGALGTSLPAADYSRIIKSIRKASANLDAIAATPTDVRPLQSRATPHYSPLQFQSDGTLQAMTARGVLRILPDGHEASASDDAAAAASWPLTVSSGDGRTWESLVPSCDRSEITLVSRGPNGNLLDPELTGVLAPRPGLCAGEPKLKWHLSPIRFDDGKPPLALLEGACLVNDATDLCLKPAQLGKPQPGSPISPDGHWLVAATAIGIFILGGSKPELWEGPALGNANTLSDCVVANGGGQIACIKASRLWLFGKPSPDAVKSNAQP